MMNTRFLAMAAASVIVAANAAMAADLPSRRAPAPIAASVPVFTWTGFYGGVNAGYAWGNNKLTLTPSVPGAFDLFDLVHFGRSSNEGSFSGGGQIGYNYQVGAVVLGTEADFNYLNLNDHYVTQYSQGATRADLRAGHKAEWFGTVRARIGFTPADRLLVYGTGGLAFGSVKTHSSLTGRDGADVLDLGGSKSDTRWGWALGAGAEYAVTNNLTLKAEYLYVDLGSKNLAVTSPTDPIPSYRVKDETSFHAIRAGLNYKFSTY